MHKYSKITLFLLLTLISGCGGGGSDPDASGASARAVSEVNLAVSPRVIDTGENFLVRVQMKDIDREGVSLKVRYPGSLRYVSGKTFIETKAGRRSYSLAKEYPIDEVSILLFDLSASAVAGYTEAIFEFNLQAAAPFDEGSIDVDVDIYEDDGFSASDPKVTPIVQTTVKVFG